MAFTEFESRSFTIGLFSIMAIVGLYLNMSITLLYLAFSLATLFYFLLPKKLRTSKYISFNDFLVRIGLAGIILFLFAGLILLLVSFIVNTMFIQFLMDRLVNWKGTLIVYLGLILIPVTSIVWTGKNILKKPQ